MGTAPAPLFAMTNFQTLRIVCLCWMLFASGSGNGQAPPNARVKDFQAPAADESGRKSLLKGADAVHLTNGIFKITAPHVDTFRRDGAIDMTIDAAECLFDNAKTREVWSDKSLSVKRGD